MNITHVDDKDIVVPDTLTEILEGIFKRQSELHEKYKGIEYKNGIGLGLVENEDFNIDSPRWQYVIKDYAWRVTEEMTEAMEAQRGGNELHESEELIDALHFYTELLIICGITSPNVLKNTVKVRDYNELNYFYSVYPLGLACNLLKNKPWKNSHLITDHVRFRSHLIEGYEALFVKILKNLGSAAAVFTVYYKKSLVNQFRQESNY